MNYTDRAAQRTRFDLSFLYAGVTDPLLQSDVLNFARDSASFYTRYAGKVSSQVYAAICEYEALEMRAGKLQVYVGLQRMLDVTDATVQSVAASVEQRLYRAMGESLSFFPIEVGKLSIEDLARSYKADPGLLKYQPWINRQQLHAPHRLADMVEGALIKREPFGPGSWGTFFEEVSANLRFTYRKRAYSLEEILKLISDSASAEVRSSLLQILDKGLAGPFETYMAQALYVTAGSHALEVSERGYTHPMEPAQKDNMLDEATVRALHDAVMDHVVPIARRFYRLKAKMLGLRRLAWSDRNAPISFKTETRIPFEKAQGIVLDAYQSFDHTMGALVRGLFSNKRIDASVSSAKQSGAFNWSAVLPKHGPTSFVFLQYLGTGRSVMTLAHELGHAVHGLLAGETHGLLSSHTLLVYAEMASVFGERLVFEALKTEYRLAGDDAGYLSLLFSKIDDMMNTVLRQISFSNFERRLHGMDVAYRVWGDFAKRSADELSALWMDVTYEMYGKPGDVFTYEHTKRLWSYVSHFHRPFYVYSYAFGELLTHSLYAKRGRYADTFASLYLDVLRAGGTKDVKTLLRPFAIDPTEAGFWKQGITSGIESMVCEAEERSTFFLKKRRR